LSATLVVLPCSFALAGSRAAISMNLWSRSGERTSSEWAIVAMSIFSGTTRTSRLEQASVLDPGSYRIHLRLAEGYLRRGSCTRARAHARAARDLFPHAPAPKRVLARCGR